jgi:hypothetical protein
MRIACLVLFAAGAAFLGGGPVLAADDELVTVEGVVTFKGKPIADATITIHLKGDQFVGARIKDGKYRIDRVPIGEMFPITIESKKIGLPEKYSDPTKSPLRLATKKGKNTADIELRD